jgi:hypothetical protein
MDIAKFKLCLPILLFNFFFWAICHKLLNALLIISLFLIHPKNSILHIGIKTTLASNPNCPSCGSSDVDANRLIPNKSLRNSIQKYKDEHGDPDDQPLEPPPTQEAAPIIEEPTTPVETGSTENKPRNGNQAPTEVPQVSFKWMFY